MRIFSILRELIDFLKTRKKWWLVPVLLLLVVFGAFLFFASTSVVAPFIYTVF